MSIRKGTSVIAGGIYIDNTPISGSANAVSSGGVYTALLNKADVDLSNINASSTAIETIVGWGIPDFSRQATLSNGTTPVLATQNMYVWGALPANGYFYVNTTNTYDPNSNDKRRFGAQNGWSGGNCIVPKGCYYYANTTSGSLYWCPLKGE